MQESTYSAFMVEGVQKFGTRATQVILQKIEDDESPRLAVRINSRSPAMQQDIVVGPPLFTLKIRIRTPKYVSLSWTRLPANLRPAQEQYVMLRQNRPIGISFDTTFTDRSIDPDSAFQYQVLARGSEGKYYASNTVQMPGRKERQPFLRSTPATLSEDSVRVMLKEKNLFHSVWNEESSGFANQFDSQEIKGDKVIIDGATGLMWQQSGSPDLMIYDNAKKWIADLNRKGYAGFHDWRLPTLEEAMSLIEPEKRHSDLYIEPAFDKTQFLIWTSDMVKGGSRAWIVGFLNGDCYGFDLLGFSSYVRAVRSGQSSAE
ncbi:DUF1566 domain-containing protein [candidate division KSB1 bacterium]|nr:DUF1566 domain-containing protein [candidate division KSB1 bacterium]